MPRQATFDAMCKVLGESQVAVLGDPSRLEVLPNHPVQLGDMAKNSRTGTSRSLASLLRSSIPVIAFEKLVGTTDKRSSVSLK